MTALRSLLALLEVAEKERDEAFNHHERLRQTAQAAQDQASALRTWRQEYIQRWQTQFQQNGSMEIVRCYQDFMLRMAQAIAEQDATVERIQHDLEKARTVLQVRETRACAVNKLIDRRRFEMNLYEQRREQKSTDELAVRAFFNQAHNQPVADPTPTPTDFGQTLL